MNMVNARRMRCMVQLLVCCNYIVTPYPRFLNQKLHQQEWHDAPIHNKKNKHTQLLIVQARSTVRRERVGRRILGYVHAWQLFVVSMYSTFVRCRGTYF